MYMLYCIVLFDDRFLSIQVQLKHFNIYSFFVLSVYTVFARSRLIVGLVSLNQFRGQILIHSFGVPPTWNSTSFIAKIAGSHFRNIKSTLKINYIGFIIQCLDLYALYLYHYNFCLVTRFDLNFATFYYSIQNTE